MTSLTRADLESLPDGIAVLETVPPQVVSEAPRSWRLRLQSVLLAALPGRRAQDPFKIYWRHFF